MSTVEITAGTVEPLEAYARAAAGGALTGSSNLRVEIRRVEDDYFYDFNDSTFKASGWTTKQATLTQISATNAPGKYRLSGGVNTTGWNLGDYDVTFVEVSTSLVVNSPEFAEGTIRIVAATPSSLSARIPAALDDGRMSAAIGAVAPGAITATAIADGAITAAKIAANAITSSQAPALANLDVALSSRLAAASYSAPPSAASIASQVWSTALPGAFSSGQAGHLVGTYLDAAVSSRLPTSSYAAAPSAAAIASQVLGTAVPGAFGAGSLGYVIGTNLDVVLSTRLAASAYAAAPSAAAVAAQVWATAEGTPTSGTFGYALWVLRQGLTNRLDEAAGNPGALRLYRDDGATVLLQWSLRDANGQAVTAQGGSPARRGAAT